MIILSELLSSVRSDGVAEPSLTHTSSVYSYFGNRVRKKVFEVEDGGSRITINTLCFWIRKGKDFLITLDRFFVFFFPSFLKVEP